MNMIVSFSRERLYHFEDEVMRNCRQTTFSWTAASSLTSCAADVRRKNSLA